MADIGINFRSTSGYVTDGANETYCLGADAYPTSRGGHTFGWETGTPDAAQDRNAGIDRRIAGTHSETTALTIFRVDLPSSGDYDVELACGDNTSNLSPQDAQVVDDTTTRITLTANPGAANWVDATNTVRTSAADWTANQTAVSATFASTICRVELRNSASGTQAVNHIGLTGEGATGDIAAAGSLSITGAADLDATGSLAAAGAVSITGAADLDALGALLAAGALSISGAADLDALGSLAAAGSLAITGSADLTDADNPDMVAAGTLSITGAADLDATGRLTAAGALSIVGAADLDGSGVLVAAGALSITGSAAINARGQLTAAGQIAILGAALLRDANAPPENIQTRLLKVRSRSTLVSRSARDMRLKLS